MDERGVLVPLELFDAVIASMVEDIKYGLHQEWDMTDEQELLAELRQLRPPAGCVINEVLSRVCSRGTKSCEVFNHSGAENGGEVDF